jgi:glycolate oxidase iron-sulfur subunit
MDRMPRRLQALEALVPQADRAGDVPAREPAHGQRRATVGLLTGCVQRVFFSRVNAATVRVLAAEGIEVVAPPGQGCCGALSLHAGREAEAKAFARRTIEAFDAAGVEAVVVNAAGCGSAMKGYGRLLQDDPRYAEAAERFAARVRDVNELLAGLEPRTQRHPVPVVAAYQDACHLRHAQGISAEPRAVLGTVPGVEVRELREPDICCGSAGIYNLLEPEPAAELGERKARHVLATDADVLVTANPGCALQLRASLERLGRTIPIVHPVEVVDASIRGATLHS